MAYVAQSVNLYLMYKFSKVQELTKENRWEHRRPFLCIFLLCTGSEMLYPVKVCCCELPSISRTSSY